MYHRIYHLLEQSGIPCSDNNPRQGEESIAPIGKMPRITGLDTSLVELFDYKLVGCILQAVLKVITRGTLLGSLLELLHQLRGFLLSG